MAVAVPLLTGYPAQFRTAIIRSTEHVLARIQQATTSLPPKELKRARHILSYALKLDEAWPHGRDLLLAVAPKMEQAGHPDDWMIYLESGIQQSQKLKDLEAEAELRFYLGVLHQHLADFDEARRQFELSGAHFERVGNSSRRVRALNRLAFVARRQRRFDEATQLVQAAIELSKEAKEEQAYSYLVLGSIAFDQRAWEKAHRFFQTSLTLSEKTNNQRQVAWGLTNLGTVLRGMKQYEEAIASYERAIDLLETIQDPENQAVARMNLGNVYLVLDRPTEALKFYLLAEPVFRKTHSSLRLAKVNHNKGLAYYKLEQWNEAKQAYLLSIDLSQKLGNIRSLVNSMDGLGSAYFKQGLYDKAISTFQDALNELAHIKEDPSYERLLNMLTRNLDEAMALI